MEWWELLVALGSFAIGTYIINRYNIWREARNPCYACGYEVGVVNRVHTNGNWYHFECWVRCAREKVFGDKVDQL